MDHLIEFDENLAALGRVATGTVPLVYIDPPFNTGYRQERVTRTMRRTAEPEADRRGFGGHFYATTVVGSAGYNDQFDDYLAFLEPRFREIHRVLASNGSCYIHIDPRESHYVKVLLDLIFGRQQFLNEIIWAYDYGGRSRRRWPAKHDTILLYVKDIRQYVFDIDATDRIPYLAPSLVGAERAARGKTPTDVWWHTIVSPTGKEKTGYPTQKPLGILRRMIAVSSRPGDLVLDCFAGSGTTGAAAVELGRRFHLIDNNAQAIDTMRARFATVPGVTFRDACRPSP